LRSSLGPHEQDQPGMFRFNCGGATSRKRLRKIIWCLSQKRAEEPSSQIPLNFHKNASSPTMTE